ncbi:MAG: helix-turn-helix domain-containing protein [Actinomycetales bacterium]
MGGLATMNVVFRNVDVPEDAPVTAWPYEALVTVLEEGLVNDWQPVIAEIRREPWGPVARKVEDYVRSSHEHPSTEFPSEGFDPQRALATFLTRIIKHARQSLEERERAEVSERVLEALLRSGLTAAQFAERLGTSASRFSTYVNGSVMPSAALLLRMERIAQG